MFEARYVWKAKPPRELHRPIWWPLVASMSKTGICYLIPFFFLAVPMLSSGTRGYESSMQL